MQDYSKLPTFFETLGTLYIIALASHIYQVAWRSFVSLASSPTATIELK